MTSYRDLGSPVSARGAAPGTSPVDTSVFDVRSDCSVYDALNAIMFAGLHRGWPRRPTTSLKLGGSQSARRRDRHWRPRDRSCESCRPDGEVIGVDFSEKMLELRARQSRRAADGRLTAPGRRSPIPRRAHARPNESSAEELAPSSLAALGRGALRTRSSARPSLGSATERPTSSSRSLMSEEMTRWQPTPAHRQRTPATVSPGWASPWPACEPQPSARPPTSGPDCAWGRGDTAGAGAVPVGG